MDRHKAVLLIFITTIATVVATFLVNGTLVPFLNEINYTNETDASFYVHANALQVVARIPISILLGYVSSTFGSVHTLGCSFIVAIVGILLLLISRANSIIFLIAYLLFSIVYAVRVLRIAIISDLVAPDARTTLLALHQLLNPISNLLAPLYWIQIQKWKGHVLVVSDLFELDRFSLSHLSALALLVFAFVITTCCLSRFESISAPEPISNTSRTLRESEPMRQETSNHRTSNSATIYGSLSTEVTLGTTPSFYFYLALSILGRISGSIAEVSFQPILVDIFMVSDAGLGHVYLATSSLTFGFPLISAILSRYLHDRELLLIGVLLKLIGNLLYLPIFGSVGIRQLVVANVLTMRAAMFQTATWSSYTKTARDGSSRKRGIANLNAGSNAVGAFVRFVVARWILDIFNGWWFSIITVPTCLALFLILVNWNSLSGHEYDQSIIYADRKKSTSEKYVP